MNRLFCALFFLPFVSLAFVDAVSADSPLLAYWEFNDVEDTRTAVDTVAGRRGSVLGGATYTADAGGRTGAAGDYGMDFGTRVSGPQVRVADGTFLNTGSNTVTYSFWQQLVDNPSRDHWGTGSRFAFLAVSASADINGHGARANVKPTGEIVFGTAGENMVVAPPAGHDFRQWNHYAFVKDGDSGQIWVNGTLAVEGSQSTPLPTTFTELTIGSLGPHHDFSLQGKIDDFAVFDAALAPEQIERLAAGESALSVVSVETRFIRGDVNADSTTDISDSIAILDVLFLGQGELTCQDAADANDDGRVDISDAIMTLEVLFLGQGTVPPPGTKECGVDPTDDELECETPHANCVTSNGG